MKKFTAIVAMFAVFGLALSALAQGKTAAQKSDLPNPFFTLRNGLQTNDYLTPLLEFQKREAEYMASEELKYTYAYMMSYLNSYIGNYATAHQYYDGKISSEQEAPQKDLESSPIDGYRALNAVEAIGAVADRQQVVMINEEHDEPLHRAFTARLLPILYAKGFRYFAAETLAETDAELNRRGYPTQKTGFYTADPVYGDLIRTALKLGFKVVPYEHHGQCQPKPDDPTSCQDERERGQAQNLYDRILKNDPKAKILVHVGRGHNQKLKQPKYAMMAWHFKQISGIEPFTIDQMFMSERSGPAHEQPLYRYVINKRQLTEPTAFQSASGEYWKGHGFDLQIFHPRTRLKNGRPTWLEMGGRRMSISLYGNLAGVGKPVNPFLPAGPGPYLVQAFVDGEGADAIPVDQVVVWDPKQAPVLMLPREKIRIRAMDRSGKVLKELTVAMDLDPAKTPSIGLISK